MIYVKVETSHDVAAEHASRLSRRLAEELGRLSGVPASEIRTEVLSSHRLRKAEAAKAVHVELLRCDLAKDKAGELRDVVCAALDECLGVGRDNVYIAVISTRNSMWRAG